MNYAQFRAKFDAQAKRANAAGRRGESIIIDIVRAALVDNPQHTLSNMQQERDRPRLDSEVRARFDKIIEELQEVDELREVQ